MMPFLSDFVTKHGSELGVKTVRQLVLAISDIIVDRLSANPDAYMPAADLTVVTGDEPTLPHLLNSKNKAARQLGVNSGSAFVVAVLRGLLSKHSPEYARKSALLDITFDDIRKAAAARKQRRSKRA